MIVKLISRREYAFELLVVAGGGFGGSRSEFGPEFGILGVGGGGAGAALYFPTKTALTGTVYPIVVGAAAVVRDTNGQNSSAFGETSFGGGFGGGYAYGGGDGGCGGGAGGDNNDPGDGSQGFPGRQQDVANTGGGGGGMTDGGGFSQIGGQGYFTDMIDGVLREVSRGGNAGGAVTTQPAMYYGFGGTLNHLPWPGIISIRYVGGRRGTGGQGVFSLNGFTYHIYTASGNFIA